MTCSVQWQESTDVNALIDHFEGFEEGCPRVEVMLDQLYMLDDLLDQLRRQHFDRSLCVIRDNLLILERFFSRHGMALVRSIIEVVRALDRCVGERFALLSDSRAHRARLSPTWKPR